MLFPLLRRLNFHQNPAETLHIRRLEFLKRENVLLVVLHADHDPALLQCRVVECLGKGADLGGG